MWSADLAGILTDACRYRKLRRTTCITTVDDRHSFVLGLSGPEKFTKGLTIAEHLDRAIDAIPDV